MEKGSKTAHHRTASAVRHFMVALLIFLSAVGLLSQRLWKGYHIQSSASQQIYGEDNWVLEKDGQVLDSNLHLPDYQKLEAGKRYRISSLLTYDGSTAETPYAFFYVHHMYCKAYLDGQELYSYTEQDIHKLDWAKSPGNIYVSIALPHDCQGKLLSIDFFPTLSISSDYELPNVAFGDYPSVSRALFLDDLPNNIISLLAAFIGVAAILFASVVLTDSPYREGIFIGIFAILFSFYNMTECVFNFFIIANPYYTYLLKYTAFSLIDVAMMAFMRERFTGWQRKVSTIATFASLSAVLLELVLHFTGVMDMREFLPIMHTVYLIDLLLIITMVSCMQSTRRKSILIFQLVPLLIGMLLDLSNYYSHWCIISSNSSFTTIGVLIFLLVEACHVWSTSIRIYMESARSQEYHAMAYIDTLTGVGNRRAYDAEKERILSGEVAYRSLIILSADVNNLKLVNDTQGHAAGDFLIRNTAAVLSEISSGRGCTFRTGGDEFMSFLYDIPEHEFRNRLDQGEVQIAALNSNSEVKLSIAMGYEIVDTHSILPFIRSAEKKMYANKTARKELLRTESGM